MRFILGLAIVTAALMAAVDGFGAPDPWPPAALGDGDTARIIFD